jgi:FkbM family methyltransferase
MKLNRTIEIMLNALPAGLRNACWVAYSRDEAGSALKRLRARGFSPALIIDGGAFRGNWTRMARGIFPQAKFLMIEAQPGKAAPLAQVCRDLGNAVEFATTLLGPKSQDNVPFFVMETGSSVLAALSDAPRQSITLPMLALDELLAGRSHRPLLLKLDLQGFELEALKGATQTLRLAEVVMLETSLLPYNQNAPLFDQVVAFMKERDFLLFDLVNLNRWQGSALFQLDAIFVKSGSPLRNVEFRHSPAASKTQSKDANAATAPRASDRQI